MSPSRLTVRIALAPAILSIAVLFVPETKVAVLVLDGVLGALLLFDWLSLPRPADVTAERGVAHVVSVRRFHPVTLTLTNRLARPLVVDVNDDRPDASSVRELPKRLELPARSRTSLTYELELRERGEAVLGTVFVRATSNLGLWHRILRIGCESRVRVYPDLRALTEYRLLARRNLVSLLGIHRVQRPGGDTEFERLREYQPDDELKHVAWKATAKRDRLISKTFQQTQNQSVVFLLDCGRMMRAGAGEPSHLDHALQASLMLAQIALTSSDAVGMLVFSDRLDGYLPPRAGADQLNRLIHLAHDKFPRVVASNYEAAFQFLERRLRKRSLLILASHVVDDASLGAIQRYLRPMRGRHLPLVVFLRDPALEALAHGHEPGDEALYQRAAATEILEWRRRNIDQVRASGVLCLDVPSSELDAKLINEYLRIKAAHLL
ncbi:MAG: DUF58 domain-containing protein [bacterium]